MSEGPESLGRPRRVIIVGGGAAGFFAAITCAETSPDTEVLVLEKTAQFLSKVRISGGGRCNVTNACRDPRELSQKYPRGGVALVGPLTRFGTTETVAWFEEHGVPLKTEPDGRMFPSSNTSQTIIDCLLGTANRARVRLLADTPVAGVERVGAGFLLRQPGGQTLTCDRLMLATGGCRAAAAGQMAVSLGHTLVPPVPSLFTFEIKVPWLNDLAGISVPEAQVSAPELELKADGPLLLTHTGLSGPAVLRLSAWGAREMHERNYSFPLRVNWLPQWSEERAAAELESRRAAQPARRLSNTPLPPLPTRLWERLVEQASIPRETRLADLSRAARHRLLQQLARTELVVTGKSLNRDEFVTCGGVRLSEVNFKNMESRICPGLFFGGELLDVDGLTGGYNFQSAWTTGWLAGHGLAASLGC
jgi:predicted Rossmann fold flavoprotein